MTGNLKFCKNNPGHIDLKIGKGLIFFKKNMGQSDPEKSQRVNKDLVKKMKED